MTVDLLWRAVVPEPSPSPSPTLDPFGRIPVERFPPAPDWLFPFVMVITAIGVAVVCTMIVMWLMSRRKATALMSPKPPTEWVDLAEFDPRKDRRREGSPKAVREPKGPTSKRKPRGTPPA